MKQLTILRHAKAERPEGYATDLERPLTSRGHKDAAAMAAIVADLNPTVDWIVSSPAVRTRQTTEHLVRTLNYKRQVAFDDTVYDATADALLTALTLVPPEAKHTLLIGHNPGMEELVSGLCAGAPDRLHIAMATGAFAHLELELFFWNQIRWGCGRLQLLVKPKVIK
jgi:phosphohistidine phosphatase